MLRAALAFAAFAALIDGPTAARADHSPYYVVNGYALAGHDAVAYVVRNVSVVGDRRYALEWKGAIWLFESAESMTTFEMNPYAYAPQYGGYCASSVAQGQLRPSDPDVFVVIDGRLYLNASKAAQDSWTSDPSAHIAAADRNWPAVLKKAGN